MSSYHTMTTHVCVFALSHATPLQVEICTFRLREEIGIMDGKRWLC